MSDRDKLIELIHDGVGCPDGRHPFGDVCDGCKYFPSLDCNTERLADNLIANGVTFATDNSVGDKGSPTEPLTNGHRWIPETERLPERNERVLCRYVFGEHNDRPFYQVLDYYAFDPHPHFQHEGTNGMCVTHWMPLPPAPKE